MISQLTANNAEATMEYEVEGNKSRNNVFNPPTIALGGFLANLPRY